jgi:processive 1,2-diacylglycerol beta-glucosyltransferase
MSDVLIFTASYGGGHWQAARALAKEICHSRNDMEIDIVDFMELISPVLNKVTCYTYKSSMRNTPALYGYLYWMANNMKVEFFLENSLNNFGLQKILAYIREHSPRLIIATYPMVAGLISYLKRHGLCQVPMVMVITDNTRHSQWVHAETDLYLTGSEYVRDGLLRLGVPESRIAVTGIPIDMKFNFVPDRPALCEKFGFNPEIPVILVMTGADGMMRGIPSICRMLDDLPQPLQVMVITGRDKHLFQRLGILNARMKKPMQIFGYVNNVQEMMGAASLLITKAGGLTVSEALAVGLPMVIYRPIPGQEGENARYLTEAGAAVSVQSTRELKDSLCQILSQDHYLDKMRGQAQSAGHPLASRRAAALILELLNTFETVNNNRESHLETVSR